MEFLGHKIDDALLPLIEEVKKAFPQKTLRVAPYKDAARELQTEIDPVNMALAEPGVDDYIAIWIKPDRPDGEFQAALGEELIHHLQAASGIVFVSYVEEMIGDAQKIKEFWHGLSSVALDLDAHRRLKEMGLHAVSMPAKAAKWRELVEFAEQNPETFRAGRQKYGPLPDFILTYWDLDVLGDNHSRAEFAELQERLWAISPGEVREMWERIARQLKGEPRSDLEMIAEELRCRIKFQSKETSGKTLLLT